MTPQRLIFQVSLTALVSALLTCAVAQETQIKDIEVLDEDFLLFLAEGMEVDGDWKDPMTLANLSELEDIPSDEIAWVAEQDKTALEAMAADRAERSSNDGEDDE